MFTLNQAIIRVVSVTYLLAITFTGISFTGFWADFIFIVLLLILLIKTLPNQYLKYIIMTVAFILTLVVFCNPFLFDTFKMRSFYYQKVNGRVFNAYFKPVGAYAGGYGNFWITESPKFFPIIEREVYYDRTVDYNFNDNTFEGQPVDNYEVVRNYIKSEVIEKSK